MPTLTATLVDRGSLGGRNGDFASRIRNFEAAVRSAQQSAALVATKTSRSKVKRVRPLAPTRAGRYHGLRDAIRWAPVQGGVGLAKQELDQKFPVWLVQEIGTGQRATQRVAGRPNPSGRPAKNATYIKTVKPQAGRPISSAFVFATKGGTYSPAGAARGQQLYLRSQVKGAPVYNSQTRRTAPRIVISKEIEGQHFVRDGGRAGSREYRRTVLAAARTQLRKKRR